MSDQDRISPQYNQYQYNIKHKRDENIYMLFAGWEVRMVKNCDRGFENNNKIAFSRPRSQFFTIQTDP